MSFLQIKRIKVAWQRFRYRISSLWPETETERIKRILRENAEKGPQSENYKYQDPTSNPQWTRYSDYGRFGETKRRVFGGTGGLFDRKISYFSMQRPYMSTLVSIFLTYCLFHSFIDDLIFAQKAEWRVKREMEIFKRELDAEDRRFWRVWNKQNSKEKDMKD